ncbi:hypothetical protein T492DRAFT_1025984, partial [Pavlovales sp. CCMP2436]
MPRHAVIALAALLVEGGVAMRADSARGLAGTQRQSAFRMSTVFAETVESLVEMPNKIPNRMFIKSKLKMPHNGIEQYGEGDSDKDPEIIPIIIYEEPTFSYETFASQIAGYSKRVQKGDNCSGRVILITPSGALVDIGTKASAILPNAEASLNQVDDLTTVFELGQSYDFQVITSEDENGQLQLSRKRLMYAEAWQKIDEMHAIDADFDVVVASVNRGGAIVLVEGLRAFLPGSHLAGRTATEDMVGETIKCKFLDVDKENSRVVVSNRRAIVDKEMKDIEIGQVVEGVVTAIKPYGVFVSMNGVAGLLHISQISSDRVYDLEKALPVGMRLKCMVVSQDASKGRLALSTKTLEGAPGQMLKDPDAVYANAEVTAATYV